jgi:hypothetical protein
MALGYPEPHVSSPEATTAKSITATRANLLELGQYNSHLNLRASGLSQGNCTSGLNQQDKDVGGCVTEAVDADTSIFMERSEHAGGVDGTSTFYPLFSLAYHKQITPPPAISLRQCAR